MPNTQYRDALHEIFEQRIPFNRVLGLRIDSMQPDTVSIRFRNHPELVGNYLRGTLHGGVTASVLDVTGGLVALLGALSNEPGTAAHEALKERFSRLGTIDLRVDYLRPGSGAEFRATGVVLRAGNKVAVTRMELHDADDVLVAVGTGTYMIG